MNKLTTEPTWWETDERLTHAQAAEFLGLRPCSLSASISRGLYKIKRYRIGRRYWYRKSDLMKAIEGRGC